jgi:hypothetical protein
MDVGQQRGRRHLGEAAWRELLRRFDQGDETVGAFCQREGVSKSTFTRWRSRGVSMSAATSPMAATSKTTSVTPSAGFVDLGALCAAPADAGRLELTLDLGGGVTLRVVRG